MFNYKPKYLLGGDSFLTIDFGGDGSLGQNLYIQALEKLFNEANFSWLIDTTSLRTTIMVQYRPTMIEAERASYLLHKIVAEGLIVDDVIRAKLIHIPVFYDDPWTRKCAEQYGMPPNLEVIASDNGLSVEEVIEIHTRPRYFVSYISFIFGGFSAFPIDPSPVLKNSKYKTPREITPAGTLGIAGTTSTCYPIIAPGGLMMLGIIPCRTFDTKTKNPFFKEDPLLVRPGNVLKFISIDEKEYDRIKLNADDYVYQIEETEIRWKEL